MRSFFLLALSLSAFLPLPLCLCHALNLQPQVQLPPLSNANGSNAMAINSATPVFYQPMPSPAPMSQTVWAGSGKKLEPVAAVPAPQLPSGYSRPGPGAGR